MLPTMPTPVGEARPYLGVSYTDVTPSAESGQPAGALVGRVVAGGPALDAGVRVGDVIFQVDGRNLTKDWSLDSAVNAHQPGEVMTLTLWRAGEVLALSITLGQAVEYVFSFSPIEYELKRLGLSLLEVAGGLVIQDVIFGSPAHRAGLEVGDLVVAVNDQTDLHSAALPQLLEAIEAEQVVTLTVERSESRDQMVVTIGAGPESP